MRKNIHEVLHPYQELVNAQAERIRILEEQRSELLYVLKACVEGLGCQPGYIKSITLQWAVEVIAKMEAGNGKR